uniref:DNA polymerase beta n=1 Tax=viral metagenome TaxID=1070528 RepID=A0A6C0KGC5_9ZZZZ
METKKKSSKPKSLKRTIKKQNSTNKPITNSDSTNPTNPTNPKMAPLNATYITLLSKLNELMMAKGEVFRARAYKNAKETIMGLTEDITSWEQLKGKSGIGETILKKFKQYEETGKIEALEREKDNPILIFTEVHGIGPKKAQELVSKYNITTLDELKQIENEVLNESQRKGLKYYDEISQKIPREEIQEYKAIFASLFDEVKTPGSSFEIVGSYRRGAKKSGDIDIIITNKQNNIAVFDNFIKKLIEKGIIIEQLSKGKTKMLGIGRLPNKIARRIDFLYAPPQEYSFAVLYFTGSAAFNVVMREYAIKKGYTMNEHGLYVLEDKKKGDKIDIIFPDERSIFDFLGLQYKTPEERKDGKDVIPQQGDSVSEVSKMISQEISSIPKKIKIKKKKMGTLKKEKRETPRSIIKRFQEQGIDVLEILPEDVLNEVLITANKYYYNDKPLITDNEYDIIKEFMEKKFPNNKVIKEIGAPIKRNKVTLPYFMGSMDKIKPDTNILESWKEKYTGPYVLSAKLDGVSGLYSTEGDKPKLYTRGNGSIGQDISHLIPYLSLPSEKNIVIRGEFILSKKVFETKYKSEASNSRNLVSGIINSLKKNQDKYEDIDFVTYEVIKPSLKPSEQMKFLKANGFKVVLHKEEPTINNKLLSELLISWREGYEYEIDGVIVIDDKIYPRENKNPDYAFAFKMVLLDQMVEAKVVDVLWTPSKDGYLKPRIRIEPVTIGGAVIEYATGFNAAFVKNNKIGVGAVIQLIRSGDVIPHILDTIVPASVVIMPNVPYHWNETHIDILLDNPNDDITVREKNIAAFFQGLGVEGLSFGNTKRLMKAGYNSIAKIIDMSKSDFLNVDGFKEKTSNKLYTSIKENLEKISLSKLMAISNLFGRGIGEKRIKQVLEIYPDILVSNEKNKEKTEKIISIKGFAKKTAEHFVEHISRMVKFIKDIHKEELLTKVFNTDVNVDTGYNSELKDESTNKDHPLYDKSIVLSGFRDKNMQGELEKIGTNIANTISNNIFVLVVKDKEKKTSKIIKAESLSVPIMLVEEFKEKYM